MKQKILIAVCAALAGCTIALAGCGGSGETASSAETASETSSAGSAETSSQASSAASSAASSEASSKEEAPSSEASSKAETAGIALGGQLEKPQAGDTVAVIQTSAGTIKIRLFPEQAPKTVENFIQLAKKGDYNGSPFHRIIDGFMIQTGTTETNQSIYGDSFEDEFNPSLVNIRGAVSMANTGQPGTNSTQFFINQNKAADFVGWEYYEQGYDVYKESPSAFTQKYGAFVDLDKVSDAYKDLYTKNGGSPTLDGAYSTTGTGHTVFGQVYEGMDIVDDIASINKTVDQENPEGVPQINTISIETYQG